MSSNFQEENSESAAVNQHPRRPDPHHVDQADPRPRRRVREPLLLGHERDSMIRPHRWSEWFARVAIEAGRDIDRQHPRGTVIDRREDRKSTRLNSSHITISYAVFCLK